MKATDKDQDDPFINILTNYFLNPEGSLEDLKVAISSRYMRGNVQGFTSSESDSTNAKQSQTTQCTEYPFVVGERGQEGRITFIDTPGFGDTRGQRQDEANLNGILDNASRQPHLSSIIMVVNGTVARETATVAYAKALSESAIPDILKRNLILVFTHCSEHECNTRPEDLGFEDIDPEQVFYMNNSLFSTDPLLWNPKAKRYLRIKFQESIQTAQSLVSKVALLSSVDAASHMQRMKELRFEIQQSLHGTRLEIQKIQQIHGVLLAQKSELHQGQTAAQAFSNFKVTKKIITKRMDKNLNYRHSTVCSIHSNICHENCALNETTKKGTNYFSQCAAFNNGHKCSSCAHYCRDHPEDVSLKQSCSATDHYHDRVKIVEDIQTIEEILEDMKARYEQATAGVAKKVEQMNDTQGAIAMVEAVIAKMKVDIADKWYNVLSPGLKKPP